MSFSRVWQLSKFQTICYLSITLWNISALCSLDTNIYLAVSSFAYLPNPSLAPNVGAGSLFTTFLFLFQTICRKHAANLICVSQCQSLLPSWHHQSHSIETITCILHRGVAATWHITCCPSLLHLIHKTNRIKRSTIFDTPRVPEGGNFECWAQVTAKNQPFILTFCIEPFFNRFQYSTLHVSSEKLFIWNIHKFKRR